jgi:hypothetical protein
MTDAKAALRPDPAIFDQHCRAFTASKAELETVKSELDAVKASLILLVSHYGYVPTNAEKSMRLEGIEMLATVTTGTSTDVNNEEVTRLQLALSRAKMPRVFSQLFARTVKHSLKKNAPDILKLATASLAEEARTALLLQFAACFSIEPNTPSLAVEEVAVLREKEAAKEAKAAAKAARAAKPKKAKKAGK